MKITFRNFGKFDENSVKLVDTVAPNGEGKTTTIQAYIFALTGRTLNGYEPRKVGVDPSRQTEVILYNFGLNLPQISGFPPIRRVIESKGTTLYIGNDVFTQTFFKDTCMSHGIDLDFVVACANVNVLTDASLTSENLRKLLTSANVMNNDETSKIRKEIVELRKRKKTAESFALTHVSVPARTCEPLNTSERLFADYYEHMETVAKMSIKDKCETCGQPVDQKINALKQQERDLAQEHLDDNEDEYQRIVDKRFDYNSETVNIDDVKRLLENAKKARTDVVTYDESIKEKEDAICEIEANAVREELPDGVDIITESTTSTGTVKSVCTLTYNGVPLKSINYAKRVELCVQLLHNARNNKGMTNIIPIIVDNAESVQGLNDIPNVIKMTVG